MGSCVSKKASRGSATAGAKGAPPQLPPEKENAVPPVVVEEEEEEVKEVLSETAVPRPRLPEPEPEPEHEKVKKAQQEDEEQQVSDSVSAGSSIVEKPMLKFGRSEQEAEKRALEDSPGKARERRRRAPSEQLGKNSKDGGNGSSVRARSPSPGSSGHSRRQSAIVGQQPVPVPRREQPAVVSGIGCRSGRFYSPSAARRAAESAVRRTYSAREADMALPSSRTSGSAKRSLNASINGNTNGVRRGDPGERSGRRSDSPTARRPPASPAANGSTISRQASATRRAPPPPKEDASPEKIKQQLGRGRVPVEVVEDEFDGPALSGKQNEDAAEGPLGQNPSVAMECFIFL